MKAHDDPSTELAAIREQAERQFDEDERTRPHAELPDSLDPILQLVRPVEQQGDAAA